MTEQHRRNRSVKKDRFKRTKTLSVALTEEEYEFIYEMNALAGRSTSSHGRDLLIADALRTKRSLTS